jgi:hypothetical protein
VVSLGANWGFTWSTSVDQVKPWSTALMLMNCSDTDTAPVCHQPVRHQDDLAFDTAGAVSNRGLLRLYRRWDLATEAAKP